MRTFDAAATRRPARLESPTGMVAEANDRGALTRLEAHGRSLLANPATGIEAGPANVHLRILQADRVRRVPLLGESSPSSLTATEAGLEVSGRWAGLDYRLGLVLSPHEPVWCWHLEVTNGGEAPVDVDAVLTHDPALAPIAAVDNNHYYVSQYLDLTPLESAEHGIVLGVRQNMPGPRVPWLVVGSLGRGVGWATDALQVHERTRGGPAWSGLDRPGLPSARWQHEHALAVLADEPVSLAPGQTHRTGFFGLALDDHPDATGAPDLGHVETAVRAARATTPAATHPEPYDDSRPDRPAAVLAAAPVVTCRPLSEAEIADLGIEAVPGSVENGAGETPATWLSTRGEVVTAERELEVLRPHAQILRTGDTLAPDAASLTTTVWMSGVFHSQVTRGHVGRRVLVSGRRSYLGLFRGHGLRVLIGDPDERDWQLLDLPSAWCAGLDACWWWYATPDGRLIEVTSRAPADTHVLSLEVRVVSGPACRLLVTLDTGDPGPGPAGGLELDWSGGARLERDGGWLLATVEATTRWRLDLTVGARDDEPVGGPDDEGDRVEDFWETLTGSVDLGLDPVTPEPDRVTDPVGGEVAAVAQALPWFVHNAMVHFLAPRGLEQYSGGGWGTRDVCQGPVGLLTALDRHDEVRAVLLRVLAAQNDRGDWPQAFEVLPPLADDGQQDSHGDVVYWPLLAVGEHLLASADRRLLDHEVAFVGNHGPTPPAPVEAHLRRALDRVRAQAVPGLPLPAYGHGDWNDSLQPADPDLARRLASTWTAVLQVQALEALAEGLRAVGAAVELADDAAALALETRGAIAATMVVDGVMPGYLLLAADGDASTADPLVHPRDTRTGLTHGILPWVHAVAADVLDPATARRHLDLIEQHLLGPDGARLFDRPVAYRGGLMSTFQRAEASTFWGREIGLMYVHAHLRYAEALARVGDAPGLLRALALSSPWGLVDRVPQARPRQRSCYYSSSDGAFADRYDASARYADLMAGEVALEGGWRIYSSGPGLALRLVVERLLGVRRRGDRVEIDPVLPPGADGLRASVRVAGRAAELAYVLGPEGLGVRRLVGAGGDLDLTPLDNPHRRAGSSVRTADLQSALDRGPDLRVETY